MMKNEKAKRFEVRGDLIFDTTTGEMAVNVSPVRCWKETEKRLPGESWLDMRRRTKSDRDAIDRETLERAARICELMNAHL
jgi:hypothetical protein